MNKKIAEEPGVSGAILEMLTVANEYCLFFERTESIAAADILSYFQKIAPLLYLKASLIDPVAVNPDSDNERFVTEEQWEAVFKPLREKFGSNDNYFIHDHNFDSVEASLADNMADIYQDMKDFVMLYQKNTFHARQNAVAHLSDLFRWHWGPVLINALGAVHQILFRDEIDPDLVSEDDDWMP
ncbi:MAG: DUF5063 domain-containing protein [Bacteroidales bacterium]|nr:DUF5063 domain-containing protein [Bacteroidales bacterium]